MLDITAISKTFHPGTPNARQALRQLSLHLEDGEFATIVGSNGAGKSTLFGAIAGSFYTDEGRILLDGTDLTFQPEHQRSRVTGRLFQDPMRGTAPHMTIEENLALAYLRASHGSPFRRITPRDRELFRSQLAQLDMGLEERMRQPVGLLSGGQRQALTLLMATLRKPKLLLLDEHTAALDPKTAAKVMELTERMVTEEKLSTLMITHNMRDAIRYGNRLIMLHAGRIILDISGQEKKDLTVPELLEMFARASGDEFSGDRAILA